MFTGYEKKVKTVFKKIFFFNNFGLSVAEFNVGEGGVKGVVHLNFSKLVEECESLRKQFDQTWRCIYSYTGNLQDISS